MYPPINQGMLVNVAVDGRDVYAIQQLKTADAS